MRYRNGIREVCEINNARRPGNLQQFVNISVDFIIKFPVKTGIDKVPKGIGILYFSTFDMISSQ